MHVKCKSAYMGKKKRVHFNPNTSPNLGDFADLFRAITMQQQDFLTVLPNT